jgi:hypothetical protein
MAVSASDVQFLSKVLYPRGYSAKDLYRKKALLNDIPHKKDFTSARGMEVPIDNALASGVGGTMAGAVANSNAVAGSTYLVPQVSVFGYVSMDGKVWRNSTRSKDDAAFIDYAKKQWSDGLETFMQELARMAYGRNTGERSKTHASTAPTGSTITLDYPSSTIFYRKGMIVVASATDGAALAAGTPGYATITGIDADAGTLTVDGTITTQITGISTGWSLYQSTLASDNSTGNGGWAGLGDYNPITPSASIMGVNQQLNAAMLCGVRTTDTSNLETLFIRAMAVAETQIGTEFTQGEIYLHPLQFAGMVSTKEGAKEVVDAKLYELGIQKMKLGGYTFVKDAFAPRLYAHTISKGSLEMATCGDQPEVGKAFDDPDVDQIKVKLVADGNFVPRRPSGYIRSKLPTI